MMSKSKYSRTFPDKRKNRNELSSTQNLCLTDSKSLGTANMTATDHFFFKNGSEIEVNSREAFASSSSTIFTPQDSLSSLCLESYNEHQRTKLLRKWRNTIVAVLLLGYMGFYFCRTSLNAVTPPLLKQTHLKKSEFGLVLSFGYFSYALGKLVNGLVVDRLGGKLCFIVGLAAAITMTILFTFANSIPAFCFIWSVNRYFQAAGWGALIKVLSDWFPTNSRGKVLGIVSMSYGIGDALVRLGTGLMLSEKYDWKTILITAAMIASILLMPAYLFLMDRPADIYSYPSEQNLLATSVSATFTSSHQAPQSASATMMYLLRSPKFWILLSISPSLTIIRETFTSWLVVFLEEQTFLDNGNASIASLLFPLLGTVSCIAGGYLLDNVDKKRRALVPVVFAFGLSSVLILFSVITYVFHNNGNKAVEGFYLILVALVALFLMAPFSMVEGIFALELSEDQNPAMTVGILTCFGYVTAIFAGHSVGYIVEWLGWHMLYLLLALLAMSSLILFTAYWYIDSCMEH